MNELGRIEDDKIEVTEGTAYKLVPNTRPSKPTHFIREYEDAIQLGFNNGTFTTIHVFSRTHAALIRDLLTEALGNS